MSVLTLRVSFTLTALLCVPDRKAGPGKAPGSHGMSGGKRGSIRLGYLPIRCPSGQRMNEIFVEKSGNDLPFVIDLWETIVIM